MRLSPEKSICCKQRNEFDFFRPQMEKTIYYNWSYSAGIYMLVGKDGELLKLSLEWHYLKKYYK